MIATSPFIFHLNTGGISCPKKESIPESREGFQLYSQDITQDFGYSRDFTFGVFQGYAAACFIVFSSFCTTFRNCLHLEKCDC